MLCVLVGSFERRINPEFLFFCVLGGSSSAPGWPAGAGEEGCRVRDAHQRPSATSTSLSAGDGKQRCSVGGLLGVCSKYVSMSGKVAKTTVCTLALPLVH